MTMRRRAAGAVALAAIVLAVPAAAAAEPQPVWGVDQARPAPGGDPAPETAAEPGASVAAAEAAASSTWTLSGAGWGHGVGMSQYGAMEMARDGSSAAEILGHYYTGTDYTLVTDTDRLSVNLRHAVTSTSFTTSTLSSGGGTLTVVAGGTSTSGPSGTTATVTASGSGVKVSCPACSPATSLTGSSASVYWDDDRTLVTNDGTRYRDGSMTVTRTPGASTLEVVARVTVHDEYLDYIREVPWSWPSAALQAQAAAARGYALTAFAGGIRSTCNCHVYDTTQSQVFGGYPSSSETSAWQAWRAAVRAAGSSSRGYVATYGGKVIQAFYSSSSGGRTQNSEDVWTSAVPYLRSVDDHWSLRASNPRRAWAFRPSRGSLASAFGLADVAALDLASRFESGGVRTATATSASGSTASMSGEALRSRLGLYSTYVQRPTTRYSGPTRYDVAAAVAASHLPAATTVVIASGEVTGRADAAVGGPLAQALGAPLLLTKSGDVPTATRVEIARRAGTLKTAVVVGGAGTVGEEVVTYLESRGLTVSRVGGTDRYAVSANAARRIGAEGAVPAAVVASGTALADALGAGGPAGAEGEPILLTRSSSVPASVTSALDDLGTTGIRIAGGTASVSSGVQATLDARPRTAVTRLAGADRYEVAAEVAQFYLPRLADQTGVSLASGSDAALTDALTAGSRPHITLLVRAEALPGASRTLLQRAGDVAGVSVIGGPASVPDDVVTAAARS